MADVVEFKKPDQDPPANPVDIACSVLMNAKIPFVLLMPGPESDFNQVMVAANLTPSAAKLTLLAALVTSVANAPSQASVDPTTSKEAPNEGAPEEAV